MRNPYDSIKCFWDVFLRELQRMCSRPIYFYCIIVSPLVCLFFFTSLMNSGLPSKIPTGVVDLDNTANSRNIIRTLDAMQQIAVVKVYHNFTEARDDVQRGKTYGFLYIPSHFSEDLQSFRQPKLTYYTNYVFMVTGSLLFSNMKKLTELVSGVATRSQLYARGATENQAMAFLQPITIESHALKNPSLNYSIYLSNILIPGSIMLLISLMTVYSIGSEVKQNTARSWLEKSNHSILLAITAKQLPYTIMFFIIGLFCDYYLYGILHFPCNSGFFLTIFLTVCMILTSQALGLIFFTLIPTLRLGLSFCCLWGVVSFSICGMAFPYAAMSGPVKALSYLFPLRYYYLIYVNQTLDGNSFIYSWQGYLALFIFMLTSLLLLIRLKRELIHSFYIP